MYNSALQGLLFLPLQLAGSMFATNMGATMFIGLAGTSAASGFAPIMFEWHVSINPYNAKIFVFIKMATKGLFNLKSSQMSWLGLSASFENLCYGSTAIINILLYQRGDRL